MNLDEDTVDELPAGPRKVIPDADLVLLHLAALAIGCQDVEIIDGEEYVILHFPDGSTENGWNPLLFSGDALELAVRLRILIEPHEKTMQQSNANRRDIGWIEERHADHPDAISATRRVIVRAAAEIGKLME